MKKLPKGFKDWGKKESVTLTMPKDMIIELNTQLGPEEHTTVPVLLRGSEISVDVTDLMTPAQARMFCDKFQEACNNATVKRLVDGNFGIVRND